MVPDAMSETEPLRADLRRFGQEHLLDGVAGLDPVGRERFLARLAEVDWGELAAPAEPPAPAEVEPPRVLTREELAGRRDALAAAGEEAYRAGRVAVLMVAGGQGTRLGWDGPKGTFPLGPHSGKTIYAWQAEKVAGVSRRVGRAVPLLVLTSPATDEDTRAFFAAHDLGLEAGQLRLFRQGTVPTLGRDGRALLAAPGELLENPDGHGGVFPALVASGELARLRAEGVEQLVYVQVDNVLAPVDDPVLVGLALAERADVVTKVMEKARPDEKVGHLVTAGGHDRIVEYTELTPEDTRRRTAGGELVYRWGSPALHAWSVGFLARLAERGYRPPLHRSAKPATAWLDGELRELDAWKSERFVFDLISEAERSVGLEIDRAAEFAPVKNADGDDSPATAVELASRQYVGWLRAAGVEVDLPPGDLVEVSPLLAATREQFLVRWDGRVERLARGAYLAP